MHWTRLPFCTLLSFWALLEKTVAPLRPVKAFTLLDSEAATLDEPAANAAGATTAEAATIEAIANVVGSRNAATEHRGRPNGSEKRKL
jgi:hypothetical protein